MKKFLEKIMFLLLIYLVALPLGIFFSFLKLSGRVRVLGEKNLENRGRGVLLASNHISILEGLFLPLLYFPKFVFNPFRYFPWNTPDRKNFIGPWYFFWLRPLKNIPIDRTSENPERNALAIQKIIEKLNSGEVVIIFPEGGRTQKQTLKRLSPLKRKELGILKKGIQKIINLADCDILPVWVEGSDKVLPIGSAIPRFLRSVITINIGEPIREKITNERLEDEVLELADKT